MTDSAATPASFSPYGGLPAEYQAQITGAPPSGWPGTAAGFETWRGSALTLLKKVLWPEYVPAQKWVGDTATTEHMTSLTQADLGLLMTFPAAKPAPFLQPKWIKPPSTSTIVGPISAADTPTPAGRSWVSAKPGASTLFGQEDVAIAAVQAQPAASPYTTIVTETLGFSRTFRAYMDGKLSPDLIDQFGRLYDSLCAENDYSFILQMKAALQRPRPHQMAMVMGISAFVHNQATSAVTPSMPSGHAFQTAMFGSRLAYTIQIHASAAQADAAMPFLKQHTVDVGDRRVLAHVHYPSDSLGSWILALLLQSELTPAEATAATPAGFGNRFLLDAITNYSQNYKSLAQAAAADANSRYILPIKIIQYFTDHPTAKIGEINTNFKL